MLRAWGTVVGCCCDSAVAAIVSLDVASAVVFDAWASSQFVHTVSRVCCGGESGWWQWLTEGCAHTRSSYDEVGDGYLREYDLETYISDLIPTLANLRTLQVRCACVFLCVLMSPFPPATPVACVDGAGPAVAFAARSQESFKQFYVFTAVRKFMYFLDPKRTGKIAIRDIVSSRVMAELQALQSEGLTDKPAPPPKAGTPATPQNWFSAANALRVYGQYLDLDTDMNGMLSKEELSAYGERSGWVTVVECGNCQRMVMCDALMRHAGTTVSPASVACVCKQWSGLVVIV